MFWRKLFLGVPIAITPILSVISCVSNKTNDVKENITMYSLNDAHGRIVQEDTAKIPGLQTMAGYLSGKKYDLLLNGGDLIQGTAINDLDFGRSTAQITKYMGFDAIAIGNHEFDFGLNNLLSINQEVDPNFLSANILYKENNQQVFRGSKIKELTNGLKVGIIGLTTPETISITKPSSTEKIKLNDVKETLTREINNLKNQNINLIVVVSHIGNRDELKDIISDFGSDIDIIVGGHTHELYFEKINDTYIMQSGSQARVLQETKFDFNQKTGLITKLENNNLSFDQLKDHSDQAPSEIQALVKQMQTKEEIEFSQVIGNAPLTLYGSGRGVETNGTDFAVDSMYYGARKQYGENVDFAINIAGGIRDSINQGEVTKRTIYNVYPFGNLLRVVKLKGSDIKEMFEYSLTRINSGGMLQVSYQVRIEYYQNSNGEQIKRFLIRSNNGDYQEFNDEQYYIVAINDFIGDGGEGYTWLKKAWNNPETKLGEYDKLSTYLQEYFLFISNLNYPNKWQEYEVRYPNKRLVYLDPSIS